MTLCNPLLERLRQPNVEISRELAPGESPVAAMGIVLVPAYFWKDYILLVHNTQQVGIIPGGVINRGEKPGVALARELREELSVPEDQHIPITDSPVGYIRFPPDFAV